MKLSDRIKRYESASHQELTIRLPVMIRLDGRAFHTYTRGMDKPFDANIMNAMVSSALIVAKEMQGFKAAYIQSDEASFVITDYDTTETQGWFDYDLQKIVSISAAVMSIEFNEQMDNGKKAVFDSRAFNVPVDDVANAFLWRAKDWERNSLQMYARSVFSSKQLHGKKRADIHEMLHQAGLNWATDLTEQEKNGTFIIRADGGYSLRDNIQPRFHEIDEILSPLIIPKIEEPATGTGSEG